MSYKNGGRKQRKVTRAGEIKYKRNERRGRSKKGGKGKDDKEKELEEQGIRNLRSKLRGV